MTTDSLRFHRGNSGHEHVSTKKKKKNVKRQTLRNLLRKLIFLINGYIYK